MFESLLKNKQLFPGILEDTRLKGLRLDWKLISFLNDTFQLLGQTLKRLEGEKIPTLNMVIPCIFALERKWTELKNNEHQVLVFIIDKAIATLNTRVPKGKWEARSEERRVGKECRSRW